MTHRPLNECGGATAVEFALVSPVMLFAILLVFQLGLGIQRWTAIQAVGDAAARCVAIAAPACSTADATASYVVRQATARGVPGVTADMVALGRSIVGGVAMGTVTIHYPMKIVGFTAKLNASGSFPIP